MKQADYQSLRPNYSYFWFEKVTYLVVDDPFILQGVSQGITDNLVNNMFLKNNVIKNQWININEKRMLPLYSSKEALTECAYRKDKSHLMDQLGDCVWTVDLKRLDSVTLAYYMLYFPKNSNYMELLDIKQGRAEPRDGSNRANFDLRKAEYMDAKNLFETSKSTQKGYGINFLPVPTSNVGGVPSEYECKVFENSLPLYARSNAFLSQAYKDKHAEWAKNGLSTFKHPPPPCGCNHTGVSKGMLCELEDGTCKDINQTETIGFYMLDDTRYTEDKQKPYCEACYNCRKYWTLCPKNIIKKCEDWLEVKEGPTWNITLQGQPTSGKVRFDEMRTFCTTEYKKKPIVSHKPTAEEIAAYTTLGVILFLILFYGGFKILQIKQNKKNKKVNRIVNAFEFVPKIVIRVGKKVLRKCKKNS